MADTTNIPDKNDSTTTTPKKKRTSVIASLDLKNYKAKYTDSYGLGKPNDVNLDNFLIAEPDPNKVEDNSKPQEPVKPATTTLPRTVKAATTSTATNSAVSTDTKPKPSDPIASESVPTKAQIQSPASVTSPAKSSADLPARDSDFERRVNAEADNDFYDEKPPQQIGETFRSGAVKRKSNIEDNTKFEPAAPTNRKLNLREPIKVSVRHELRENVEEIEVEVPSKEPIRRTETYGIVISAVAFLYSIATKDKPLLFLSVSLLLYLLRPVIAAPFGKYSHPVQNAIKGFSMALFVGSIFFIFF